MKFPFKLFSKQISFHDRFFIVLLTFYILYSLVGINNPWGDGHHGFIGGEKSRPAIYFLKFGYLETKFGQLANTEWEIGKEKFQYNVHHPIGLPLFISFSFLVFGVQEFSARLVIILSNVATIILFYLFTKEYWNKKFALTSTFFMILTPMFFYIRNFISTEVFVLPFIAAMFYFYVKWLKTKNNKFLYLNLFVFFLGTFLADWWIYFIPPALMAHYCIFKRGKYNKILLFLPVVAFSFLFYLFHVWILTGSFTGQGSYWGDILERLLFRINLSEESKIYNINFYIITETVIRNTEKYFTPFLTYGTFFMIFIYIFKLFKKRLDEKNGLLLIIFFTMLCMLYIFSNITWIHDFFVLFFLLSIPALFTSLIFDIEKKFFRNQKDHFYIFLIVIIFLFISSSLPMYRNIHEWFSTLTPLVKFVAENKGNFLVTFQENPDHHQFRFYTDLRKVKQINNEDELIKILANNSNNFEYIIVMPDRIFDKDFLNYLEKNFGKSIISAEYEVFYLK